jgi:hypothetical protein
MGAEQGGKKINKHYPPLVGFILNSLRGEVVSEHGVNIVESPPVQISPFDVNAKMGREKPKRQISLVKSRTKNTKPL